MYGRIKSPDVRSRCCGIYPLIAREPVSVTRRKKPVVQYGYVIYCPRCGRCTKASNILPVAEMDWDCGDTFIDGRYERGHVSSWYDTM